MANCIECGGDLMFSRGDTCPNCLVGSEDQQKEIICPECGEPSTLNELEINDDMCSICREEWGDDF